MPSFDMKCFTGDSWHRAQNAENFSAAFAALLVRYKGAICVYIYIHISMLYNTILYIYMYMWLICFCCVRFVYFRLFQFSSNTIIFFLEPKKNFTPWHQERSKGRTNSSYHICRSQCSGSYRRRKDLLESTEAFRVWNLGGQNFSFFQLE